MQETSHLSPRRLLQKNARRHRRRGRRLSSIVSASCPSLALLLTAASSVSAFGLRPLQISSLSIPAFSTSRQKTKLQNCASSLPQLFNSETTVSWKDTSMGGLLLPSQRRRQRLGSSFAFESQQKSRYGGRSSSNLQDELWRYGEGSTVLSLSADLSYRDVWSNAATPTTRLSSAASSRRFNDTMYVAQDDELDVESEREIRCEEYERVAMGGEVRTANSATTSPPTQKAAKRNLQLQQHQPGSRLLLSGTTVGQLQETRHSKTRKISSKNYTLVAGGTPGWLPWIPTRSQIEVLKLNELKAACQERCLTKRGNKASLQQRLLDWTKEQHRRRVFDRRSCTASPTSLISEVDGNVAYSTRPAVVADIKPKMTKPAALNVAYRSLDQITDNMLVKPVVDDIQPLINRRQALLKNRKTKNRGVLGIHVAGDLYEEQQQLDSDGVEYNDDEDEDDEIFVPTTQQSYATPTEAYISALTRTFHNSPTTIRVPSVDATTERDYFNNFELKQLYQAAKHADQSGADYLTIKRLLLLLHNATPHDTRVSRRLARLEYRRGNDVHEARNVLQQGIRQFPDDAYLVHGLGQLELSLAGRSVGGVENEKRIDKARCLFIKAISLNPTFPNPYHALGTLEHSRGHTKSATAILRKGLRHCPDNHRLHHALGDLYREAKYLDLAEKHYRKGLECGPRWSRSFFYAGLSYLAYDRGELNDTRKWLRRSIDYDGPDGIGLVGNGGMHAQGWMALAQLEESEGKISEAREIYKEAVRRYEAKVGVNGYNSVVRKATGVGFASRPVKLGDRWMNVYHSWARMEENYGSYQTANNAYSRTARAFPTDWQNLLKWAQLQERHGRKEEARALFELACDRSGNSHPEPYRLCAEFEMSIGAYFRARSILVLGAQSFSESSDCDIGHYNEFARLYHTWAVCEWHLQNLDRADVLFDYALRLTEVGHDGSETRSLVLYSMARFLHSACHDHVLAQHCVCLALTESITPGGNSKIWLLWADIARAIDNNKLSDNCLNQAERLNHEERSFAHDVSQSEEPVITGPAMQQMLRKEPWYHKIFAPTKSQNSWYNDDLFPDMSALTADSDVVNVEVGLESVAAVA